MYEWLEQELKQVNWPGFHVMEVCRGPLDRNLPYSYLRFVRQFGTVKLYILGNYYQIGVYCPPQWTRLPEGDVLRIGYWLSSEAYFKTSELAEAQEVPVYEMIDGELEEAAPDFALWLEACAMEAKKGYTKDDWARLARGPEPFTPEEQSVVEARRKILWKFLGPGSNNSLRFSVRNGSNRFIKALTVGVKAKDGVIEAHLPIDTSGVAPGEERILEVPGYATLPAEDVIVFDLPEPTPADKDLYAELATSGPMKR